MRRVEVRLAPAAERDLDEVFRYLAREAGISVAVRFDETVELTLKRLAELPELGSPLLEPAPRLAGLRKWVLAGFQTYLVFYRAVPGGVEVIRVLHGARDIPRILEESLAHADAELEDSPGAG